MLRVRLGSLVLVVLALSSCGKAPNSVPTVGSPTSKVLIKAADASLYDATCIASIGLNGMSACKVDLSASKASSSRGFQTFGGGIDYSSYYIVNLLSFQENALCQYYFGRAFCFSFFGYQNYTPPTPNPCGSCMGIYFNSPAAQQACYQNACVVPVTPVSPIPSTGPLGSALVGSWQKSGGSGFIFNADGTYQVPRSVPGSGENGTYIVSGDIIRFTGTVSVEAGIPHSVYYSCSNRLISTSQLQLYCSDPSISGLYTKTVSPVVPAASSVVGSWNYNWKNLTMNPNGSYQISSSYPYTGGAESGIGERRSERGRERGKGRQDPEEG